MTAVQPVAPAGAPAAREPASPAAGRLAVCRLEQLVVERGAVVVVDGRQLALFRLADDTVHALSNRDPYSGAMVLARGVVGDRRGRPVVISPVYKQAFDLHTGRSLDDLSVGVATYETAVEDGVVLVTRRVLLPLRG